MKKIQGRWMALTLLALTLVAAVPGLLKLKINPDISGGMLPVYGSGAEDYAWYLENFPTDKGTIVLIAGNVASLEAFELQMELVRDLEKMSVADRVLGLPNVKYAIGEDDFVQLYDFSEVVANSNEPYWKLATEYQAYKDVLITADASALAIYIRAEPAVDAVTFSQAMDGVLSQHRSEFAEAGMRLEHLSEMRISADLSVQTQKSTFLVPTTSAVMALVAWWLTGSLVVGLVAGFTGLLGALLVFALMGYLGVTVTTGNSLAVNAIVPLGASYAVHAYGHTLRRVRRLFGFVPVTALVPFIFATVTTMVGFGMNSVSPSPDIKELGIFGAVGVAALFCLIGLFCFPIYSLSRQRQVSDMSLVRLPALSGRAACVVSATLLLLCGWGVSRLTVDYAPVRYLLPGNKVLQDFDWAGQYFPQYVIPMVVKTPVDNQRLQGRALDPELWQRTKELVDQQKAAFPGTKAVWLYDQMVEVTKAFGATEASGAPLEFPDSRELLAQLLMLLDQQDQEAGIDFDQNNLAVSFLAPISSSSQYLEFEGNLYKMSSLHDINVVISGWTPEQFRIGDLIPRQNLRWTAISVAVAFAFFLMMTWSPTVAFIGTFVNALPVFGAYALLGWFDVPLDLGTSIVASIALGLVLDDTGHFLASYVSLRKTQSAREAVRRTLNEVWRPMLYTAIVISIGFSVMNLAYMTPFHTFSRLLAGTMVLAVACDLLLLPALLIALDRRPIRAKQPLGVSTGSPELAAK